MTFRFSLGTRLGSFSIRKTTDPIASLYIHVDYSFSLENYPAPSEKFILGLARYNFLGNCANIK
jgi:hypothetical protein